MEGIRTTGFLCAPGHGLHSSKRAQTCAARAGAGAASHKLSARKTLWMPQGSTDKVIVGRSRPKMHLASQQIIRARRGRKIPVTGCLPRRALRTDAPRTHGYRLDSGSFVQYQKNFYRRYQLGDRQRTCPAHWTWIRTDSSTRDYGAREKRRSINQSEWQSSANISGARIRISRSRAKHLNQNL